jgi:DeoR/GlpR family transcriptional regulator of sugar metabolism
MSYSLMHSIAYSLILFMERHKRVSQLLTYLGQAEELSVEAACKRFDVSPATIRRDFVYLTEQGLVEKTWGGIRAIATEAGQPDTMKPLNQRSAQNLTEKRAIAEAAAALIEDGDVVMIDGGSTTAEMVPFLAGRRVKVITNSLTLAQRLDDQRTQQGADSFGVEVFLTGGFLYPASGMLVGPQATENIRRLHAQWVFLSSGGVSEVGVTNSNMLVVDVERAMMAQSQRVVLLTDYAKIGHKDLLKLCDLTDIHILLTNEHPDAHTLETYPGIDQIDLRFV